MRSQRSNSASVLVHYENLITAVDIGTIDDSTVGEKAAICVVGTVVGKTGLIAAVNIHGVDFIVAVTIGIKYQLGTVGGKIRSGIVILGLRIDIGLIAAVYAH